VTRLVSIVVPEEELVRRLSGRLVCREANHPYHETDAPPREPGRCDVDGSELYRRADDDEATVRRRFRVFTDETEPVLERYRATGTPISAIDGARPRDVVRDELIAAVEGAAATAP
jgi:adenylate kinase